MFRNLLGFGKTGTDDQAPTSNIQRNSKFQVPISLLLSARNLGFGASLDVGCWSLFASLADCAAWKFSLASNHATAPSRTYLTSFETGCSGDTNSCSLLG